MAPLSTVWVGVMAHVALSDSACEDYFGSVTDGVFTVADPDVGLTEASAQYCKNSNTTSPCTFMHLAGQECVPPAPPDGCHHYHKVQYSECPELDSFTYETRVDTTGAFDENGVFVACADKVISNSVLCFGPPADAPVSCTCNATDVTTFPPEPGPTSPNSTTPAPVPVSNSTTPAPAPTTPAPSAGIQIQSLVSSLCVDLPGGDTSNGALLWTWDCYGGDTQQWSFKDGQLVYAPEPSKCVDLLGGDTTDGNQIGLWDCNQMDSQMWGFDPKWGTIYLASSASSDATKCAQIRGENKGDPVEIWDCTIEPYQIWKVGSPSSSHVVV